MSTCEHCGQPFMTADTCEGNALLVIPGGVEIQRIPHDGYGSTDDRGKCPGCGVAKGGIHHLWCDVERCPACNGNLTVCGHLDVSYQGFLEEHRARVSAEKDVALFEGQAHMVTECFTKSFTKDVSHEARRAVSALKEYLSKEYFIDIQAKFDALLDRLSVLQSFVEIISIPEDEGGGFCARLIASSPATRLGDGETPQEALKSLASNLDAELVEKQEILRSEHSFRSALRHVQTEMVAAKAAFGSISDIADRALDDEDGKPQGFFTNLPPQGQQQQGDGS